jgi:predicted DNA-binding transcriptional regulator AlpA
MKSKLLTVKDLRLRLNCATSTIYRWMDEDYFPRPLRLGGMARWEEEDVNAFLEKAKLRRTKSGLKPQGIRRPGRPSAYPNTKYLPKI